jgi:diguanylate cyclase (GGDEF)-like protein
MRLWIPKFLHETLGHPLMPVFGLIMAVVTLTTFGVMVESQRSIIEHEAIKIAEVVARQALASRSVYTEVVTEKLVRDGFGPHIDSDEKRGYVPLPAQFLKLVGHAASQNSAGLYRYRPLSKWNLEPTQGLNDDFQRWAWRELERQDQTEPRAAIDWKPVWRFEKIGDERLLRYMRADPASGASCVGCHNQFEARPETKAMRVAAGVPPGKRWKQHQLLGAIEVNIPVSRIEEIAAGQAQQTLVLVIAISLLGMSIAAWYAFHDSRRKQALAGQFERQAQVDALTGLANRMYFQERAREELARAARDRHGVGVLFVDLDRFKRINDSLGHEFGDVVLKKVAQRLRHALREVDILARHSGDEFTVLLHGRADADDVMRVARKLLHAIGQPFPHDGHELYVTASIGISRYPEDGQDVDTLIKSADIAMYRAKEQGRNRIEFFSAEMDERAHETLSISNSLRQAIERDQLMLYYQPRVDVKTSRIVGVEATLRWNHPELGLLEPLRFIQLAEDTGMISEIGRWVVSAACKQLRSWDDAGVPSVRMAVNLSTRQFQAADLVDMVNAYLNRYQLPANRLELEITESVLMHQPQAAEHVLTRLHATGVVVAIDDFGTGYSSLSYLKLFPIDYLKIDKSFIDGLPNDGNDRVITEMILSLARKLNVKVVAEGVETVEQYAFLAAHDCDELQGFLFSRSVRAEDVEPLLRRGYVEVPE